MINSLLLRLILLASLLLSACASSFNPQQSSIVLTPSLSPSPSATTVWFPPTSTPLPSPAITTSPTPNTSPIIGEPLIQDTFDSAVPWELLQTSVGRISLGENELTITIQSGRNSLTSLRSVPEVSDFYLVVDVNPSLCRGSDAYGVIFRAMSSQDYNRLVITCDGQLRLERVRAGRAEVNVDWQPSSQILPGAATPHRLGVAGQGEELRFYIDDVFQFSARDRVFTRGRIGLFARPAGDNAVTVSFSNLRINTLLGLPALPTLTPTPTLTPRPK